MPQERLPKQVLLAKVKGKTPETNTLGRLHRGSEWNRLGFQPSEILGVVSGLQLCVDWLCLEPNFIAIKNSKVNTEFIFFVICVL